MSTEDLRTLRDGLAARRMRVELSAHALDQLEHYYQLLKHWNKRINLTSLELTPLAPKAIDRLFVEPLMASSYIGSPSSWIDLGSGGGSPAIPMKIVRPDLPLMMVESRSRKASFLRETARQLGLRDVTVICERFDAVVRNPDNVGSAELVTIRAVRLDDETTGVCSALLKPAGKLFRFGPDADSNQVPTGFLIVNLVTLTGNSKLTILRRS